MQKNTGGIKSETRFTAKVSVEDEGEDEGVEDEDVEEDDLRT